MELECIKCKKIFKPDTNTSAAWQKLCRECYLNKRKSFYQSAQDNATNNSILSLEGRVKTLENDISQIDMLVGAEISNAVNSGAFLDSLKEEMTEMFNSAFNQFKLEMQAFRERIQGQLVVINNKMVVLSNDLERILEEVNE